MTEIVNGHKPMQGNGLVLLLRNHHDLFLGRATLTPPVGGGETCLKSAHFSTNGAKNGHEESGPQNRF